MSVDALIMLLGVLVALLPQLGFPNSWDNVIFFLLGVLVVALGIIVRRRKPTVLRRPARKPRAAAVVHEEQEPAPRASLITEETAVQ